MPYNCRCGLIAVNDFVARPEKNHKIIIRNTENDNEIVDEISATASKVDKFFNQSEKISFNFGGELRIVEKQELIDDKLTWYISTVRP